MKKSTRKKSTRSYSSSPIDDHNFIIIAGGGFVLLVLIIVTMSGGLLGGRSKLPQKTQANSLIKDVKVTVDEGVLSPSSVRIKKGSTVVFVNNDSEAMAFSSDDGTFRTEELLMGNSDSVSFENSGTFSYSLGDRDDIRGVIVVE